jgi:GTP-binding protein
MPLPKIAIVGRPNVGKSSVFNWLAGRRIAIVDPTAGVTRDRLTAVVEGPERAFEVVDTGGIGIEDVDNLTPHIERQIQIAIDEASLILFVVDGRAGIAPLDEDVAERLRHVGKPVVCVVNKCDTTEMEPLAAEFFKLGHGAPVSVSALQNRGKAELLRRIEDLLPADAGGGAPKTEEALKLAIVGRRNTGKSTFINCLAEEERVIVSEVPGTTRDSIDVRFERDGKVFIAIDTAGVRRKNSVGSDVEFYSVARAERSIRRADVVLLFHDAALEVSKVDKQLAGYVLEHHKPAIFVINKWDLLRPRPTGEFVEYFRHVFPNLDYVPMAFITAKSGKNVHAVVNLAQNLHKQAGARVSTADLNRVLRKALALQNPPLRQNRRAKIYYATQVDVHPPTIVLFTNGPELLDNTYQRYLLKMFRDHLPFRDVPIKMTLRLRGREEETPEETAGESKKTRAKRKAAAKDATLDLQVQEQDFDEPVEKPAARGRSRPEPGLWKDL